MDLKKNILIYGASGYLGLFYSRRVLESKKYNLIIDFSDLNGKRNFDLKNIDTVLYFAVIHQTNKDDSKFLEINTYIPIFLAKECEKRNIQFLYMSTEQVFQSNENYIYKETDIQNAKTIYGFSKGKTEKNISNLKNICILRTSMIYGYKHPKKKNLFTYVDFGSILPFNIFKDAFTTPTYIDELCDIIDFIVENRLTGVYHAVGNEMIDRVSLLKKYFSPFYSEQTINFLINPVLTPANNNDIQKCVKIETSTIFKDFFKVSMEQGLRKQYLRGIKVE